MGWPEQTCRTKRSPEFGNSYDYFYAYKYLDDPNHPKNYGSTYTERQLKILSGEIPWEVVRFNQLTLLANKAQAMGDDESHKIVLQMIECKKTQEVYKPQISPIEAKEKPEALHQ